MSAVYGSLARWTLQFVYNLSRPPLAILLVICPYISVVFSIVRALYFRFAEPRVSDPEIEPKRLFALPLIRSCASVKSFLDLRVNERHGTNSIWAKGHSSADFTKAGGGFVDSNR